MSRIKDYLEEVELTKIAEATGVYEMSESDKRNHRIAAWIATACIGLSLAYIASLGLGL